jgi:hypothetical protein
MVEGVTVKDIGAVVGGICVTAEGTVWVTVAGIGVEGGGALFNNVHAARVKIIHEMNTNLLIILSPF